MKLYSLPRLLRAALVVTALTPLTAFAQQDPETAARQAEIDASEAQTKIEELQREQIAAGDVQNETTVEMNARDNLIGDYEQQEDEAERRLRNAEARER